LAALLLAVPGALAAALMTLLRGLALTEHIRAVALAEVDRRLTPGHLALAVLAALEWWR
jgi:hypothetical protein